MISVRGWALAAAFCALALAGPATADDLSADTHNKDWWNTDWKCRRTVQVDPPARQRPGREAAFVEFTTGGSLQKHGEDVRVVLKGNTVPRQIVSVGPGDKVSLMFSVLPGEQEYQIYYGNPDCADDKTDWTPQRGLILETRRYRGGECGSWIDMQDTIDRAGDAYGRGLVGQIFHAHNPFGVSQNMVSTYKGWLEVPRSGEIELATSSAGASFMFIDDAPMVRWAGWHGPQADPSHNQKTSLAAGLHSVAYYSVQRDADPCMVAAWRTPAGSGKFEIIPASAFLPPLKTSLRELEIRGTDFAAGFVWQNLSEGLVDQQAFVTMQFREQTWPIADRTRTIKWEFGDGTTASTFSPSHTYLATGLYSVALTFVRNGQPVVCRQQVMVDRDWDRQTRLEPEPLAAVGQKVRDYRLEEMTARSLSGAMILFRELGRDTDAIRAWRALTKNLGDLPQPDACEAAAVAAKFFRESQHDPQKAIEALRLTEGKLTDRYLRARMAVTIGDTLFFDMNNPVAAKPEYERVVNEYSADQNNTRMAMIRLGDVARLGGQTGEARQWYAKSLGMRGSRQAGAGAMDSAMRALETEDALRRGDLGAARDTLNLWQWQDPDEKLGGEWSLLSMKTSLGEKNPQEAVKEGETLLRVNSESQYAPEILLVLADAYRRLGQPVQATAALEKLKKQYPDSPLAKELISAPTKDKPK